MSVLLLAAAAMVIATQKNINNSKFRSDADTFNEEMRAYLSSTVNCNAAFNGLTATSGSVHPISSLPPNYTQGQNAGDGSLQIKSMQLNTFVAGTSPGSAQMTLLNEFTALKKENTGSTDVVRRINIALQLDAANAIISCVALAKMSDGIWQRSLVDVNNIFYSGLPRASYVGIGTNDPKWPLQINASGTLTDGGLVVNETSNLRAPSVKMFLAKGVPGAEAPVTAGATIGNLSFSGLWRGKANPEFRQGDGRAQISAVATEDWLSNANNGSAIFFATTPNGTGVNFERMRIDHSGNIGIGTTAPYWNMQMNTTSNSQDGALVINHVGALRGPSVKLFRANGSPAIPTSVNAGDTIGNLSFSGMWRGKANGEFRQGDGRAQINAVATENWTGPSNNGNAILFATTTNGMGVNIERLRIDHTGNVGIATQNPSYALDVRGQIRGFGVIDSSDVRLKKDIAPIEDALEKILRLDGGVYFNWRDSKASQRRQIGLIAQDVEKEFPELVETDSKGMKAVNYSHLVGPLIKAVKTLEARVKKLEIENRRLRSKSEFSE